MRGLCCTESVDERLTVSVDGAPRLGFSMIPMINTFFLKILLQRLELACSGVLGDGIVYPRWDSCGVFFAVYDYESLVSSELLVI